MEIWNFKFSADEYIQNTWNNTLITKLNDIKKSIISECDIISASYVLKNLLDSLNWLHKPIINYRYDNEHSIYYDGVKILIENFEYNHQNNEEWIESQKNLFNNLNTVDCVKFPNIWKNKDSIYNYLDWKYTSGRIINNGDIIYCGILHNFKPDENYLVYFHIDELKSVNCAIYEYYNNDSNISLLPNLMLKQK